MPPILTTEMIKDGRRIKVNNCDILAYVSNGWERYVEPIEESEIETSDDLEAEEIAGDKEFLPIDEDDIEE